MIEIHNGALVHAYVIEGSEYAVLQYLFYNQNSNMKSSLRYLMTKITETWCPQCQEGTHHEDRFIDAKIGNPKVREIRGIWMMLKCMKCGIKHSPGFKLFR
jgi:ribosomal protein L44E